VARTPKAHYRPGANRKIVLSHGSLEYADWTTLLGLLSDEERRRADRFAFERDARRFVVSHAVLRKLLGQFVDVPARELQLRAERGAKPVLKTWPHQIHFGISRSEERFLIAFASRPLGADMEWLHRKLDIGALASQVLSHREKEAIKRLGPGDRQAGFLRCWTQKEAYLKAISRGLVVSPASIEVSVGFEKL
jgi:4'-phosphopantetheinyl transferase